MTNRTLRLLSPEIRLAVLRNRVVAGAWLLFLTGVLTAIEPITGIFAKTGVSIGLLLPPVLGRVLGQPPDSWLQIAVAFAAGAALISLGTSLSVTRSMPAAIATALLGLDLLLVAAGEGRRAFASFPVLVTVALRCTLLYYVIGAWFAVGARTALAARMAAEDATYEAERSGKPAGEPDGKWGNAREDDDQG